MSTTFFDDIDLDSPPSRDVPWLCIHDDGRALMVYAQTAFYARRRAAVAFLCEPDRIIRVRRMDQEQAAA